MPNGARHTLAALLLTPCAVLAQDWTLLRDVLPGTGSGVPIILGSTDSRTFFVGNDGANNHQLWATDGTPAGTALVKTVTLPTTQWFDRFRIGASVGDVLVLGINDGFSGMEPWRSDGTAAGTMRLADIAVGGPGSEPGSFLSFGGRALFNLGAGQATRNWASDGGATVALDTTPRTSGAVANGALYFGRDDLADDLARIGPADGAPVGIPIAGSVDANRQIAAANDRIFFAAFDAAAGSEPWMYHTISGASGRVADVWPGTTASDPSLFTHVDDLVYFVAGHPDYGSELWVSDGTEAGTRLVRDIAPGTTGSSPDRLVGHRGRLYFAANGGTGKELWVTDGTAEGTVQLTEFSGPNDGGLTYSYNIIQSIAGRLMLSVAAVPECCNQSWISDGTPGGTRRFGSTAMQLSGLAPRYALAGGRIVTVARRNEGVADPAGGEPRAIDPIAATGPYWCETPELALPDQATVTSRASLPAGPAIAKLTVSLDLFHSTVGDLRVTLRHVDTGTAVTLIDPSCTSDLVDVTLDDGASAKADAGCNAAGRLAFARDSAWQPTQPLASFAGENLSGTWELEVVDTTFRNAGVLHEWCLLATAAVPTADPLFTDGFE